MKTYCVENENKKALKKVNIKKKMYICVNVKKKKTYTFCIASCRY